MRTKRRSALSPLRLPHYRHQLSLLFDAEDFLGLCLVAEVCLALRGAFIHPLNGFVVPDSCLLGVAQAFVGHREEEVIRGVSSRTQFHRSAERDESRLKIASAKVGDAQGIPVVTHLGRPRYRFR